MTDWQNFTSEIFVKLSVFERLKGAFKKIYILLQSKISIRIKLVLMMEMELLRVEKIIL